MHGLRIDGLKVDEPSDWLVVLGEGVPMYEKPSREARILDVVGLISVYDNFDSSLDEAEGFNSIRTANGTVGYVESRFLCSPMDMRFKFSVVDGRWRLLDIYLGD